MLDYIKRAAGRLTAVALMAAGLSMASCADDIVIDNVDEDNWASFKTSYAMLKSVTNTTRTVQTVELRSTASTDVRVKLTKAVDAAVSVNVAVATDLVEVYNNENYTDYEAFPAANVSINGPALLDNWQTESDPVTISLTYPGVAEGTYLLPVRATTSSTAVTVSESSGVIYYMIKVMGSIPDNTKYVPGEPGRSIANWCYVEVNGADLRNVGGYQLETSGKLFFDYAIIFAANIKYDSSTGRVFLHINENITHILDNADVYIKPLQDMGLKVILSLLGGGDFTGLSSLRGESLRDFAQQVKNVVEVYNLDGVDFDDEWSSYDTSATSMWTPSSTQLGRLIIECRRLMPDKTITLYEVGSYARTVPSTIDGYNMSDILDYALQAYYGSWVANSYTGLPNSKYSPYAYWVNTSTVTGTSGMDNRTKQIRSGGYGMFMCYSLGYDDATTNLSIASLNMFDEPVIRTAAYEKTF